MTKGKCANAPLLNQGTICKGAAGLLAVDASDGLAFSYIQGWHMFLLLNQELKPWDALQSLRFQHL